MRVFQVIEGPVRRAIGAVPIGVRTLLAEISLLPVDERYSLNLTGRVVPKFDFAAHGNDVPGVPIWVKGMRPVELVAQQAYAIRR